MRYKILLLLAVPASAVLAEPSSTSEWKGEAELGFVTTSGNTNTENLNAKANISNERPKWRHSATAEVAHSSDNDITTSERYLAGFKTDYKVTSKSYIFGLINYEDDRFSGYDYQATVATGYGRRLLENEAIRLEGEAGIGYRRNVFETNNVTNEALLRGAINFDWKFSKTASLREKLTIEAGEDNTITRSITAVKAKLNSKLAAKMTYTVKDVRRCSDWLKSKMPDSFPNLPRRLC